jgi:hypothetical protein
LSTPFPQKLNNWTHVLLWNLNSSYLEHSNVNILVRWKLRTNELHN